MVAPPKFAHVVINTNRLTEMRDWYCAVLDAHVVYENEMVCFITYDDEHHRVAFATAPGGLPERLPNSTGLGHTAYTFASISDLMERYSALRARGIEPHVPIQHGLTTSLYYQDPDGQHVEMQIENFATLQEASDYMRGAEFAADPVGPSFDPALMYDDYKKGVLESELLTRAWALQGPKMPDPLPRLLGLDT